MNTTPNIPTEPPTREGADAENIHIAIAFWIRPPVRVVGLKDYKNPFAFLLFAELLKNLLQPGGFSVGQIGAAGDLCDGLIRFQTTTPKTTLEIVRRALGEHLSRFASVAWFDHSKQEWCIHLKGFCHLQFDEFLSDKRQRARRRISDRFGKRMSRSDARCRLVVRLGGFIAALLQRLLSILPLPPKT